jgi:2-polyprenyl-3-methyl-5-hydroxy-6-metoxy-1,4-benzoquinol methylase
LGCGDGLLDICLARKGACVIGADRISSVLEAAAAEPDAELVDFRSGDIRKMEFARSLFDLLLMLELIGLMSRADDLALFQSVSILT